MKYDEERSLEDMEECNKWVAGAAWPTVLCVKNFIYFASPLNFVVVFI